MTSPSEINYVPARTCLSSKKQTNNFHNIVGKQEFSTFAVLDAVTLSNTHGQIQMKNNLFEYIHFELPSWQIAFCIA